ncbi:nucleotide exchange factor GrpE [Patescibacteria group bacterium]|nr:nucleotide exchange factor GrpE [Patescibacteria group bacterium]
MEDKKNKTKKVTKKVKNKEVIELQEKNLLLENQLKSSLSDYQNLKRRMETEKENITDFKESIILREFLDIIDDIYLYIKHISNEGMKMEDAINGINIIYDKGIGVIKNQGIEEQEVKVGDDYSVYSHEVVGTVVADEDKNGKIIDIVRVGFLQNGKVIRPARVIVGKMNQN